MFSPSFEEQHERVFRISILFNYNLNTNLYDVLGADHGVNSRTFSNMSEYKLEANLIIHLSSLDRERKESAPTQINKMFNYYFSNKPLIMKAISMNFIYILIIS